MSEFVFLFRTGGVEAQQAMGTPERAAKSMQVWLSWLRELESGGHLKSPGQPLATTGKVVRGPSGLITDGPFVEVKDLVLGFMVIEARDIDEATELAKGCPMTKGGGSVEVRPVGMSPSAGGAES
jgi:hypothetical protein